MNRTTASQVATGDFLAGYLKTNASKKATPVHAEVTTATAGKWDPKHREWVPAWHDDFYAMPPAVQIKLANGSTLVLSPDSPVWTGRPEPKPIAKPATPACCPSCYMQLTTSGACPMGC